MTTSTSRMLRAFAVIGLVLLGFVNTIPSAQATSNVTVPPGSALYVRDDQGQLYRVDSTGSLVAIGVPQPFTQDILDSMQGTFDPITNASYVVEIDTSYRLNIVEVDTATGAPLSGVPTAQLYSGIAAAPGGTVYGIGNYLKSFKLQTVNLGNGALTEVADGENLGWNVMNAQAIHPSNGMLYVFKEDFNQSPSLWSIASINPATGQVSPTLIDIDESTLGYRFYPRSMAIDTNGVFWVLAEEPVPSGGYSMKLYSFVISNNPVRATLVSSYAQPFSGSSLWLAPFDTPGPAPGPTPAPNDSEALANTGADSTGVISAALMLVALGSALWLGRRRGMFRN